MKKKALFLLLLALCFLIPLVSFAAEEVSYIGVITGGSLKLRASPESSGKVLNTCKSGTEVTIVEYGDEWCHVRVGSQEGFMMTSYLSLKADYTPLGWANVSPDTALAHLFESPDEASACLTVPGGIAVELVQKENGWYKVRLDDRLYHVSASDIVPQAENADYAQRFSAFTAESFDIARFQSAPHEFGNMKRVSREAGSFTYSLTYPSLPDDTADQMVYDFVNEQLAMFEQDQAQYHADETASFTVAYQAAQLDERYQSLVLCGQYDVGDSHVQVFLAFNYDTRENRIINGSELFSSLMQPLFYAGSKAQSVMNQPANGYTAEADEAWLQYAVLTRSGVEIYLPGGVFLPLSLGTQQYTLEYSFLADNMTVDSAFIASKKRVIDPTKPMIAITFDDGPSEYTDGIISVLAQYNARATFCVQGKNVEEHADTVCRAIAFGNEIASHTWDHPFLNKASGSTIRWQLEHTNEVIAEVTGGYQVHVLRPPYGKHGATTRSICKELGMIIAHWKVDTLDWKTRNTTKTVKALMDGAKTSGVIILCHDIYPTTAEAVKQAIPELAAQGIQMVTVSELMSFHVNGAQPGTVYAYLDENNIDYSRSAQ